MGQSSTPTNRLHNEWNLVDTLSGIEIYKNQNNQLAEKHVVRIDPKIDENDYITAYYQRYLPNKPIVNVFDAQFLQRSISMCQNSSILTVFTEYIPYRLSSIKILNHGQGVYVLSEALAGFAELFGRVGPFQIYEDLIGFNQEGQVRVWYNANFADNAVDNDRIILMSTINPYGFDQKFSQNQQHDMVEDTINVVARYTQFSPKFLQQIQELKRMSFNEARDILTNQISRKGYYVPDHLFLGDNNGILLKSGVVLKNKHVVDPNKPKKGTKYPYFINNTNQVRYHHQHHINQEKDTSSQQYSQSSDYQEGGYYNLNGENYRIIGTRQIEGNEINQQAIIDEIVRRNNNNNLQTQQVYTTQNPASTQAVTRVAHSAVYPIHQQPHQTYSSVPQQQPIKQYREGHIVFRENPQFINTSDTKFSQVQNYHTIPNQTHTQEINQQNFKVFSVGTNGGRLVEERQLNERTNGVPIGLVQNAPMMQSSRPLSHRHKIFGPPYPKTMMMVPQSV